MQTKDENGQPMHIRIGTRASNLALIQTDIFVQSLKLYLDFTYEIIIITTSGDQIHDKPLYDIGGKALFLKEIEEALLRDEIDCAIHSMKDVPGNLPDGLCVAAVLERDDPSDVLVSKIANKISNLPYGAKIATSAPRRYAQIRHMRPDIIISNIRGNVQTRIDKWRDADLDGIILAAAGLKRLQIFDPAYCHILDRKMMIPAAGQGVIGIEIRLDDLRMQKICAKINHLPTWQLLQAERGFLEYLDANCRTALAAFARWKNDKIEADYMFSGDNFEYYHTTYKEFDAGDAYNCGVKAAKELKMLCTATE